MAENFLYWHLLMLVLTGSLFRVNLKLWQQQFNSVYNYQERRFGFWPDKSPGNYLKSMQTKIKCQIQPWPSVALRVRGAKGEDKQLSVCFGANLPLARGFFVKNNIMRV